MNRSLIAVFGLWILVAAGSLAQAPPAGQIAAPAPVLHTERLEGRPSPPARLETMAWLVGRWIGEGLGGEVEEVWSPARGGQMMGMFRLVKKDQPVFYELMLLVEENDSLVLKVKHFQPDFTAWEEKTGFVSFPLVRVDGDVVHFNGLAFARQPDGSLKLYLQLRNPETGQVREEEFRFRRAS